MQPAICKCSVASRLRGLGILTSSPGLHFPQVIRIRFDSLKKIPRPYRIVTLLTYVSMNAPKTQTHSTYNQLCRKRRIGILLYLFVALTSAVTWAASEHEPVLSLGQAELEETFGANTPLGRFSYQAGRGLRVGNTGLVLGGFATAEVERLERGESTIGFDGVNFLAFMDPTPYLHLFTELEIGQLAMWTSDRDGVHANPKFEINRLYADVQASDALNLRFGKFLTPVGRWNLVRIEPLLWTTSEPLIIEQGFDGTATGAMLHGSVFPRGGALSYSLYGAFFEPFNVAPDEHPSKRNAGAHVEWANLQGWTIGASYFAAQLQKGEWNHLGSVDLLWQPHERIELSGEAIFGEGSRKDGTLGGLYAQTVVETLRTLYLVGRYEHFAPPGAERAINVLDLGFAWEPAPYLRFKADYLIADHPGEIAEPGLHMSFSILF